MKNNKKKVKFFLEYCKKVWMYLELEMMVHNPRATIDEDDIYFFFEAGNDVQTAAFLIKEILP